MLQQQALTGSWDADPVHSSVGFGVRHMGVSTFRASFHEVDARLTTDGSGLELEGAARVDSISITAPPELREHVVRGDDFFEGDRHPEISFRSHEVRLREDGEVLVLGLLTVKGISRPIAASGTYQLPVVDPFGATRAAMELHAVIDRREWGMGWQMPLPSGGDVLGYEVELTVQLELISEG
jgi:polyisoprenoid-binding protein YceI